MSDNLYSDHLPASSSVDILREAFAEYATADDRFRAFPEDPQEAAELLLLRMFPRKKQGDYTVDDLDKLPSDLHFELIDGHLFVMESPSFEHQTAALLLGRAFTGYILENRRRCTVVPSWNVRPDSTRKTQLVPNLLIFRDPAKNQGRFLDGAPDFVIEILSPSTRKRDEKLKFQKYLETGVKEYWMVDLKNRRVVVCLFRSKSRYDVAIYSLQDKIPVSICGGELLIDFDRIMEDLRFLQAGTATEEAGPDQADLINSP